MTVIEIVGGPGERCKTRGRPMCRQITKAWLFSLVLIVAGCLNYAEYSLQAYTNATELKAKSLSVLKNSGKSYASQKSSVEALVLDIAVAHEFAAGIEHNNEAAEMWSLIASSDEGLVGGMVETWRDVQPDGLGKKFRESFHDEITFAFDRLICLEVNKREAAACPKI